MARRTRAAAVLYPLTDTKKVDCRVSAVVPGAVDGEPIAIHANHINMAKFESEPGAGYTTATGHLQVMAGDACDAISQQWDTEGRVNAGMWIERPVAMAKTVA